jgi:hypothetical protein
VAEFKLTGNLVIAFTVFIEGHFNNIFYG